MDSKTIVERTLQQQLHIKQVLLDELTQTAPNQPIYERFGGNVFLPTSRPLAINTCEHQINELKSSIDKGKNATGQPNGRQTRSSVNDQDNPKCKF
ncbi:hypothetical protein FGIG_01685 [Fasciola gigantica]|uniref:Prefoldin subunit 1 n=1 Tax=Fasciola gigantica TaxID=46835 RepID=A0A504YJ15_FASGI|nr:hypothetical protein FGIG_01685 [Fasciola gigantica]